MLRIFRPKGDPSIVLDRTPTGAEERENLFDSPVTQPSDLNGLLLLEQKQNMSERIFFADRAFLITATWVVFLVIVVIGQMVVSFWRKGLSDAQFVTVVTTTTASVFGFWLLVGRYLFPNKKENEAKPSATLTLDPGGAANNQQNTEK